MKKLLLSIFLTLSLCSCGQEVNEPISEEEITITKEQALFEMALEQLEKEDWTDYYDHYEVISYVIVGDDIYIHYWISYTGEGYGEYGYVKYNINRLLARGY